MRVIEPLWTTKPETAGRLRGRIESILDWARVRGYRTGENPARWKGHLDHLLPARNKVRKVEHHAALPYAEIGDFMVDLRQVDSVPARALEWMILTATRTSETLNATWTEIDLDDAVWTIPGERMKGGKEHRVPLSDAALALLKGMQAISKGDYVFPGRNGNKPLSNMALLMVLRRMRRGDLTGARFPLYLPRLVCRANQFPERDCRSCTGARRQRQGRSPPMRGPPSSTDAVS